MIPKVIHYCWFGRQVKPQLVIDYIEVWHRVLSDYEIKEWNEDNFNVDSLPYTAQAYKAKKYAFVSDVCRMYALLEGGIYLDTDVRVLRTFDNFLKNKSFIGIEARNRLGTAVIGAEPNTPWIKDFLQEYNSIPFQKGNGKFDLLPNTTRLTSFLSQYDGEQPEIYAQDFFSAKDYKSGTVSITGNTVCVHEFSSSWVGVPGYEIIEKRFWKMLGMRNLNILNKFKWLPKRIFKVK